MSASIFLTTEASEGPSLSSYRSCYLEDVRSAGVKILTVSTTQTRGKLTACSGRNESQLDCDT